MSKNSISGLWPSPTNAQPPNHQPSPDFSCNSGLQTGAEPEEGGAGWVLQAEQEGGPTHCGRQSGEGSRWVTPSLTLSHLLYSCHTCCTLSHLLYSCHAYCTPVTPTVLLSHLLYSFHTYRTPVTPTVLLSNLYCTTVTPTVLLSHLLYSCHTYCTPFTPTVLVTFQNLFFHLRKNANFRNAKFTKSKNNFREHLRNIKINIFVSNPMRSTLRVPMQK